MVVDGVESNLMNIDIGVPQGSVLGPLLFILYVNDIVNSSKLLKFSLFADDTAVVFPHTNISQLISTVNSELCILNNWFKLEVSWSSGYVTRRWRTRFAVRVQLRQ